MRISKFVQFLAFGLLTLFPLYVLFMVRGLSPLVYLVGVPAYWFVVGVVAALFHRNLEENDW